MLQAVGASTMTEYTLAAMLRMEAEGCCPSIGNGLEPAHGNVWRTPTEKLERMFEVHSGERLHIESVCAT